MIAGLLGASLVALVSVAEMGPVGIARLRVAGPAEGVLLEAGGPATALRVRLAAGEVRTFTVPLELSRHSAPGPPGTEAIGIELLAPVPGGAAELVGWQLEPAVPRIGSGALTRSQERLARRTRPPLSPGRPRPATSDIYVVAALLLGGLALGGRSARGGGRAWRSLAGVALGMVGAGVVWCLPAADPARPAARVLEGDLASGAWIEVRAGLERLALPPGAVSVLATRPAGCARSYEVEAGVAGAGSDTPRWWVVAPGCELSLARALPAPDLDLARNGLGRLDPVFLRSPDGRWKRHQPWELGAPPPPAVSGEELRGRPAAPPSWLAAALPQGRAVLVARRAETPAADVGDSWVRVLGP